MSTTATALRLAGNHSIDALTWDSVAATHPRTGEMSVQAYAAKAKDSVFTTLRNFPAENAVSIAQEFPNFGKVIIRIHSNEPCSH
jgi:hypothetical protein